jgi:hypothetical protein
MNAHNDVKRFDQGLDAKHLLAAARLRVVTWIDVAVARWLERCATHVEAAQHLFKTDRAPARGSRAGALWPMSASGR